MKRYVSVFMLMVRMSFGKILMTLFAMAAVQVGLFFITGAGDQQYLLDALNRIPFTIVVLISLSVLCFVLVTPWGDRGGRMNNLILRLGVPEKHIFWLQVLFFFLAFWMFILVQGLIMILLCFIFDWVTPGQLDPMAIFVTSYQHPVFHRFFPLHDLMAWTDLLLLVTGLSICNAAFPMRQRHRRGSMCTTVMLIYGMTQFASIDNIHLSGASMTVSLFVVMCVVPVCLYGVLTMEVDDDGKA